MFAVVIPKPGITRRHHTQCKYLFARGVCAEVTVIRGVCAEVPVLRGVCAEVPVFAAYARRCLCSRRMRGRVVSLLLACTDSVVRFFAAGNWGASRVHAVSNGAQRPTTASATTAYQLEEECGNVAVSPIWLLWQLAITGYEETRW